MSVPLHRTTDFPESAFEMRLSAHVGYALRLACATSVSPLSMNEWSRRLWPAIRLDQIEFLFNSSGAPVAYATWAFLTEESGERLASDPGYVLHLSEWNEGDQLWILDIVAFPGLVQTLIRKLRDERLSNFAHVQGIRVGRDGRPTRRTRFHLPPNVSRVVR